MSYAKAMKHHTNPRKWKRTRVVDGRGMPQNGKRGQWLIFGKPTTQLDHVDRNNETAEAEPFALDPTPPAPDPAAERRARLAMLADRAAKPITGRPVDTTGDLFDSSRAPAPLFACPTPRAMVAA